MAYSWSENSRAFSKPWLSAISSRCLVILDPVLCYFLGGMLLVSGFLHSSNPILFFESVYQYRLVSPWIANVLSFTFPAAMLLAGTWLMLSFFQRQTVVFVSGMYLVFFVAQASAWLRGLDIDCSCFGPVSHSITWETVSMALVFWMFSLYLVFREWRRAGGE